MSAKTTYYAIVDAFSTGERPDGVIRRVVTDQGQHDEAFTRNLRWEFTPLLYSYERGSLENKIYEISEEQANEIVEWIRRVVTDRRSTNG